MTRLHVCSVGHLAIDKFSGRDMLEVEHVTMIGLEGGRDGTAPTVGMFVELPGRHEVVFAQLRVSDLLQAGVTFALEYCGGRDG